MKKALLAVTCLMMVLCLFGCGKNEQKSDDTDVVFQATIVEINDGVMLVKPLESYSEAKFAELVNVVIQNMNSSPEPKTGDVIEVTYNGIMTEEDPPTPCGVVKIEIVNRGE